ncbi:MAG: hypothetical protein NC123_01875 [Butyrivibrio sp.]|nr:hypothetical protein [Acetatifactor muris]MCM1558287.1 hypothetical protein [Butyrivibrio sp.]
MIPLSKLRKGFFFTEATLLFVLLHRGLIIWGYGQLEYNTFVNEAESIIRTGPAIGIICDDTTSCIYRDNVADFENFIGPDDSVFFLKTRGYDPLFYVQAGAGVSIFSTISNPTIHSNQIDYWRMYPYKAPTVIAIACYDGEITMVDRDSFIEIFELLEEQYIWVGDGTWWKFYRIKEEQ